MSGTMLNPLLCEGQIHGGIVQGLGQALLENLVYDPDERAAADRLVPGLRMPRADNFCRFELRENATPTDRNPLGVKGVGEAGTIGAIPAVMNAVNDALARSAPRRSRCRPLPRRCGARCKRRDNRPSG